MDTRVAKQETLAEKTGERLAAIDTRLTVLETRANTFATKEDLARAEGSLLAKIADAKNSIIMWVVSAVLLAQLLPALLKKLGL